MNIKRKTTKSRPLTEEQIFKRKQSAFSRKIRGVFTGAGFNYVPSNFKEATIGFRKIEFDAIFICENILIRCEETCKEKKDGDHILKKHEPAHAITKNFSQYYNWLLETFPEQSSLLREFSPERFKVFFLYISESELDVSDDEKSRYAPSIFLSPRDINYFQWISQCIRRSARYEFFRFLGLNNEDIGKPQSDSGMSKFKAPIICPPEYIGSKSGVRVISFMMSAELLMKTCYVLRKDNWEESIYLYLRLIDKKKIKNIRQYLAAKGETFYNNIIVALPDNVSFIDRADKQISINDAVRFESVKLVMPNEMNSICVIDGQHRIFAHYEGDKNDRNEPIIASLRGQLHLLVTGLIFPPEMLPAERIRLQSELFLDINSNATSVPPDVLLQIEMLKESLSDVGISRRIIDSLNRNGIFKGLFKTSSLDNAKIKIASIVKFALRYLVTLDPSEGKKSMLEFWQGNKDALLGGDETEYNSYISFCANALSQYFGAIRTNLKEQWNDPFSKLLSVISINGFIIAYNRLLSIHGVKDFDFYNASFKNWNYNFSKDGFHFTSSQYRKFSTEILEQVFKISEDEE